MIWFKLAIREIFNNKKFSFFFVLNLSLGLLGFSILETFKSSLTHDLTLKEKTILTADLSLSARRNFTDEEHKKIQETLQPHILSATKMTELYSMVKGKGTTRLTLIKAIEKEFPYYGEIELDNENLVTSSTPKKITTNPYVWIYPELKTQLGVDLGDSITIGEQSFVVTHIVTKDAGDMWASSSMAPRVYIGRPFLEKTNLLRKGSTFFYTQLYKINPESSLDQIADQLHTNLTAPGIRVWTPKNASEQLGQLLNYLNDYLGLTTLVALFLSSIGAGFLYRSFLTQRLKDIAILNSLGVQKENARNLFLIQVILLGFFAALVSSLLTFFLLPQILEYSQLLLPIDLKLNFSLNSILITFFLGTLGSLLICTPLLLKITTLKTTDLFQEQMRLSVNWQKSTWLHYIPSLVIFWLLAMWQSHSIQVGSLFFISFMASIGILFGLGFLFLSLLEKMTFKNLSLRLAARNLYRNKAASLSCFLALSLGALLINIIPQLQKSLETEIQTPQSSKLPSLFLFDIQEEQLDPLKNLLHSFDTQLASLSPLVRARIVSVNDKDFLKGLRQGKALTREQEREMRFRNRGFNLTYRSELSASEELTKGDPFSGTYDTSSNLLPEVSIEYRFAERLSLSIGDTLKFDVQGVPISGKIKNMRKVRWTSFQPNFFVQFQEGVLNEAPKTFLASIPKNTSTNYDSLQLEMVRQFPNVSVIDVSRVVKRILDIVQKMSWALIFMAILSFAVGIIVLFSIANYQINTRIWDINLLKVLGGTFQLIYSIFSIEFIALGLLASLCGVLMSMIFSFALSQLLFDSLWAWAWQIPLLSLVVLVGITGLIAWLTTRKVLQHKASELISKS